MRLHTFLLLSTLLACTSMLVAWHPRARQFLQDVPSHPRIRGAFDAYMQSLETQPLPTKCITGFVIFAASDTTAQAIAGNKGLPRRGRLFRFALWGGLFAAPLFHVWYLVLQGYFQRYTDLGIWVESIAMSCIDVGLFTPTYTSLYYLYKELMVGGSHVDAYIKLRSEILYIWSRAWVFWVPANVLNFAFTPLSLRVTVVCILSMLWNTFFSLITQHTAAYSGLSTRADHEPQASDRRTDTDDAKPQQQGGSSGVPLETKPLAAEQLRQRLPRESGHLSDDPYISDGVQSDGSNQNPDDMELFVLQQTTSAPSVLCNVTVQASDVGDGARTLMSGSFWPAYEVSTHNAAANVSATCATTPPV